MAAAPAISGAAATGVLTVSPNDADWQPAGIEVAAGQSFTVDARGAIWMSRALALGFEPRMALWVRIGGRAPIQKLIGNRTTFIAWADGPVELFLKGLSEWASDAGDLLPGKRSGLTGEVVATVAVWPGMSRADETGAPADWHYLWRLGEGRIFADTPDGIEVTTHGDVGILQLACDVPLAEATRLDWSWRVDELPSRLPEDLQPTHDYLSIAVEFENGQDLTYMWSAGLPQGHVFRCPLNWWCERETHWVLRSGTAGLGQWFDESRSLAADCRQVYGHVPERVVRVWLIANSVFQRRTGRARFRDIRVG